MIKINDTYLINEKLIKYAVPYFHTPPEGTARPFLPISTKIIFTDNTEVVFEGITIHDLKKEFNNLV